MRNTSKLDRKENEIQDDTDLYCEHVYEEKDENGSCDGANNPEDEFALAMLFLDVRGVEVHSRLLREYIF